MTRRWELALTELHRPQLRFLHEVAERRCTRVAIMRHGKTATIGTSPTLETGLCRFTVTLDNMIVHDEATRGSRGKCL